jgi:RNA polymerase sigma-70 factor (ECF subfamily)
MSTDFEQLYNTYYMQIYSYVMTLAKNQDISEEITQKTFFKAFTTDRKHTGGSSEFTWLCAIAKNFGCVDKIIIK